MANELQTDYLTGQTVYFLLRNAVGQVWNGAAFEDYVSGNYATYDIAATEQGSSGYYTANFPAVAAGVYYALAKAQAGGSPAESDFSVGWGNVDWGGSAPAFFASGNVYLASGAVLGANVQAIDGNFLLSGNAQLNLRSLAITNSGSPCVQLIMESEEDGVQAVLVNSIGGDGMFLGGVTAGLRVEAQDDALRVRSYSGVGVTLRGGGTASGVGLQANILGNVSGEVYPVSGRVWLASGSIPAFTSSGIVQARLADGVVHGGTTATLRLGTSGSTAAFYATNDGGDAVKFEAVSGGPLFEGHGLRLQGAGTSGGDGLRTMGGLFGDGIHAQGGTFSGQSTRGIHTQGGPMGIGMTIQGGAFGVGMYVAGGLNGAYFAGGGGRSAVAMFGGSSGAGLELQGLGAPGLLAKGGLYNPGALFAGGISGVGVVFQGSGVPDVQGIVVASGSLSGQYVNVFSGDVWVASGSIPSANSGLHVIASLLSGQFANVYSGQLSGQQVNLLSGNQVGVVSGTLFPASGSTQIASGAFVIASLLSGQVTDTYSGFVWLASGQLVNVYSGQLSGQYVSIASGQTFLASGQSVNVINVSGLAQSVLTFDVSGIASGTIPVVSLGSVALKLASRFNARSGTTYLPDGTSVHMTQQPVNGSGMAPIGELGVGQQ